MNQELKAKLQKAKLDKKIKHRSNIACEKCGGNFWYTANFRCVECHKECAKKNRRENLGSAYKLKSSAWTNGRTAT